MTFASPLRSAVSNGDWKERTRLWVPSRPASHFSVWMSARRRARGCVRMQRAGDMSSYRLCSGSQRTLVAALAVLQGGPRGVVRVERIDEVTRHSHHRQLQVVHLRQQTGVTERRSLGDSPRSAFPPASSLGRDTWSREPQRGGLTCVMSAFAMAVETAGCSSSVSRQSMACLRRRWRWRFRALQVSQPAQTWSLGQSQAGSVPWPSRIEIDHIYRSRSRSRSDNGNE